MKGERFDKTVRLHECTGKDPYRMQCDYVHFDNGYAYVTDMRVLVRAWIKDICTCPEEDIKLLDGYSVRGVVYKQILKYDDVKIVEGGIICTSKEGWQIEYKLEKPNLKWPDYEKVLNEAKNREGREINKITINPVLLYRAMVACGGLTHATMSFDGNRSILINDPVSKKNIVAIVMPMMIKNRT